MARTAAMPRRQARSNRDRMLITPEGVALPLTVASRGARAGALLLDFVFLGTVFVVVTIALISLAGGVAQLIGRFGSGGEAPAALQFLIVVWMIATFLLRYAWFLVFELGPRGATPGKRLSGIRIAARDGGRLTAEMVIARNLLRDIELFLPVAFIASAGVESPPAWLAATAWFAMFLLFPCFNRDRLRAGDVIAGTWVVEAPRRKLEAAMSVPAVPSAASSAYLFTEAELAVYGEYELQTLERILREDRDAAIESVQATIAAKIGRDPWVPDSRAFLEAYYAQLRARLEAGMRMGRRKADKHAGDAS
ncbi:putative RDD family membrane protein YckC [Novosphingobium chloroacetimidivorans]|uniref:Putative RDD family membrane protein YckC n=1 Tax=Novosphingobium chloroacetimidivorans TaxID=1428314 RepID=A0A7W7NUK6_9SPHN|nr:RDD family protein [Novosphingobium chloroacetimidivorans]MBB4857603.1 putative RDD family membrane protein YckC [Novosphingobium chloroacetimidivorans]